MGTNTILILITIVVYLAGMVTIGAIFTRKNKNTADFYLGGRKLGPFVTAMSAEASDMSSWLLMGLPGVALIAGLAEASWTAIGLAIGTYINWLIVAKRIRVYSSKLNAVTVPEFFSKRFGDNAGILKTIAAIIIIIFFIPYTASGFSACGKLFESIFGIPYLTAMIVSGIVIVIYTALGGFLAASTTDFIQSIVMTIALVVVLGFGINYAGGWEQVCRNAESLPGYLNLTSTHAASSISEAIAGNSGSKPYSALTIASLLAWGLGYFGMPHILLRFMAIEKVEKIKLARRVASVWVVISMAVAIVIGIVGYGAVKSGAVSGIQDSERIIIELAKVISGEGWILAIVAGLILAGILAATMSTADSQLLAASSSVSEDIMTAFKVKISDKKKMLVARCSVVVIAIIAMFIAKDPNSNVFRIVSFAWAGFGATFGPVVLFALFYKRTNKWGALAGMVSGAVMVFLWKFVISGLGGAFAIYELLPAFIVSSIFILVFSHITAAPSKEVIDTFEEVKAGKIEG
ncbi:MAG: sodium/proline symporter PutP [Clostridia bacterium]|nr:sodium/proline symporter PutP [Clostridia bacterium]